MKELPATVEETPIEKIVYVKELTGGYRVTLHPVKKLGDARFLLEIENKPAGATPPPAPKTGDAEIPAVYLAVAAAALASVICLGKKRREQN